MSLRMCAFVEIEGVCGCLCVMPPPKPPTAPQLLRALQLYTTVTVRSYYPLASSPPSHSPATLRTNVVLPSRQFSSSQSPATLRTKVVLPGRHFSSSSSPPTPHTKVVLQSRRFSATTHSPVLIFPLPSYSAYTTVVLPSRHFSSTHSPVLLFPFPSYSAY